MKLLRNFFLSIVRDWVSAITCIAAIISLSFSWWAQNSAQSKAFSLAAAGLLFIGLAQAWLVQYRRAEKARAENMNGSRPRITVGHYSSTRDASERDQEYLIETLQIANKGDLPAFGITIRPIQIFGRTARLFTAIPSLEPGETKEIRILNLRRMMERAAEKAISTKGHALTLRLPMTVEYQDSQRERWITEHVALFGAGGIEIDVVHLNETPEWTEFSRPRGRL
jgi:hypothetical protein